MKKLIPVAFFALLALNTNAIKAANSTSNIAVSETAISNEKRADESETILTKEKDSSEEVITGSESITKSNDSTTMNSKDGAGIYISSGAALIIIVILLIILL